MNQFRQHILTWCAQGHIENKNISQALEVTGANNTPQQWFGFMRQLLLWLGVLSIAFGVIFFFAYNWDKLSTSIKFILIQLCIVCSFVVYSQTQRYSNANTATLFLLAMLLGALFALFGQTYQTGKDPWQLFLLWTLFVTPLALVSRSSSLWIMWLLLAFVTLNLMFNVRYGFLGLIFDHARAILSYALLGVFASVFFELMFYSKFKLIFNRIAAVVAILASMAAFSWVAIYAIFAFDKNGLDGIFYLFWMSAIYYFYRVKSQDILILSSWVVSAIIAIVSLVAKVIDDDVGGFTFLFLGLVIIGLSTMGGKWLMTLLKQQAQAQNGEQA